MSEPRVKPVAIWALRERFEMAAENAELAGERFEVALWRNAVRLTYVAEAAEAILDARSMSDPLPLDALSDSLDPFDFQPNPE